MRKRSAAALVLFLIPKLMVRVLTLFSGTHSVGKVCAEYGWEETSLDLYQPADIEEDVLQWDWRTYPVGYFDIIWASPDCSQYSRAKTTGGRRRLGHADKMVKKSYKSLTACNHGFGL